MANRKAIDFRCKLLRNLSEVEKLTGVTFKVTRDLIASRGAVIAARMLMRQRGRFSYGFTSLRERGWLNLSVEQLVIDFADSGLFTSGDVATARWRLKTAGKVEAA